MESGTKFTILFISNRCTVCIIFPPLNSPQKNSPDRKTEYLISLCESQVISSSSSLSVVPLKYNYETRTYNSKRLGDL